MSEFDALFDQLEAEERQRQTQQPEDEQGILGDTVDAFQRGVGQGLAGMAESVHQLTGSELAADARDGLSNWADSQLEEMSSQGRESVQKSVFRQDEDGDFRLGEGAGDWRTWVLNLSSVAGQYADLMIPGSLAAKVGVKAAAKVAAKKAIQKGATKEAAEQAGKEAMDQFIQAHRGKAAAVSYGLIGEAMSGGMVGNDTRTEIMGLDDGTLDQSNEYRRAYYAIHAEHPELSVREKRDLAKARVAEQAAAEVQRDPKLIASNLLTDAVGGRALDGLLRGVGTGKRLTNAARQFGVQGVTEGFQGGVEQVAKNQAIQANADPNRDPMQDVAVNAATEGVLGGMVGGMGGLALPGQQAPDASEDLRESVKSPDESTEPQGGLQQAVEGNAAQESGFIDPQVEREQLADEIRAERESFTGSIDEDIRTAEKLGFDEEAVRLRNAKTLFQRAQQAQEGGDQDLASRLRQRGMAIHKDILSHIPPQHKSGLPAEYQFEGEVESARQPQGSQDRLPESYVRPLTAQTEPDSGTTIELDSPQLEDQKARHVMPMGGEVAGNANTGLDGQATKTGRMDLEAEAGRQQMQQQRAEFRSRESQRQRRPEGLRDNRILRDDYRIGIQQLARDLTPGGDVAYVRDGHDRIVGRTPSINPHWYQDMPDDARMPVKLLQRAADKAIKGKSLGKREARGVAYLMDVIEGERQQQIPHAQEKLQGKRAERAKLMEQRRWGEINQELGAQPVTDEDMDAFFASVPEQEEIEPESFAPELELEEVGEWLAETIRNANSNGVSEAQIVQLAQQYGDDPVNLSTELQRLTDEAQRNGQQAEAAAPADPGRLETGGNLEETPAQDPQGDGAGIVGSLEGATEEGGGAATVSEAAAPDGSGVTEPAPSTEGVVVSGPSNEDIERAAAETNTNPTEAQIEADNYKKGRVKLHGLDIAIENPKHSTRSGTDPDGKRWESTMAHHYGDIKGTKGADGDDMDVFVGDNPESQAAYVVDQVDPKTGKFDEHKILLGFDSEEAARQGYLVNYEDGWQGLGQISEVPVDQLKAWLKEGDTKKPYADSRASGAELGQSDSNEEVQADRAKLKRHNKPIKYRGYSGENREASGYWEQDGYRVAKVHNQLYEVIDAEGQAVSQVAGLKGVPQAIKRHEAETQQKPEQTGRDKASTGEPAKRTTGATLDHGGLSVDVPVIDQELVDSYNRTTHLGRGRDLNQELQDTAKGIIDDLAKAKHVLDTPEQKAKAQDLINGYLQKQADFNRWMARQSADNPSWIVTGRSGRNMDRVHAKNERHMDEFRKRVERLEAQKAGIKDILYAMRPQEIKARQDFDRKLKVIATSVQAMTEGYDKSAFRPKATKQLQAALETDAAETLKFMDKLDKSLADAGGLEKVVGKRSNFWKVYQQALEGRGSVRSLRAADKAAKAAQSLAEDKADADLDAPELKSVVSGDKTPANGLTKARAEQVAKAFMDAYKGNIPLNVRVGATQEEIYGPEGSADKIGIVKGAYHPASGVFTLAADNLSSVQDAVETLRHEILGHYGLNTFAPADKRRILDQLIAARDSEGPLSQIWADIDQLYADKSVDVRAEEVFARVVEAEPAKVGRLKALLDRLLYNLNAALRRAGIIKAPLKLNDVRRMARYVAEGIRAGRRRQQTFPQTDDALFRRSTDADDYGSVIRKGTKAKVAWEKIKGFTQDRRRLLMGSLTNLQLEDTYGRLFGKGPGNPVSGYYRELQNLEAERNNLLQQAETEVEEAWDALASKNRKEADAVGVLMTDATAAQVHPDIHFNDQIFVKQLKQKKRNLEQELKKATDAERRGELQGQVRDLNVQLTRLKGDYDRLSKQYADLSPDAKALYHKVENNYRENWRRLKQELIKRVERSVDNEHQAKAMADQIRLQFEQAINRGPYFPLSRFGDHVIIARNGDEYIREHYESSYEAQQAKDYLEKQGFDVVYTKQREFSKADMGNVPKFAQEVFKLLGEAKKEGDLNLDVLTDDIYQMVLKLMPDASSAKHSIHRKRIKGYSTDSRRAFADSIFHQAYHLSRVMYGDKMQKHLDDMEEAMDLVKQGEDSVVAKDNAAPAEDLLNEMKARHELIMNPTGKAWASYAGNLGFVWYLGASPAAGLVNLTQTAFVAYPQLAAKYGWSRAGKALLGALFDYAKSPFKKTSREAWLSLSHNQKLAKDERELIERLHKDGSIDVTQAHSLAQLSETDTRQRSGLSSGGQKAMRYVSSMFHNAEVVNREVTALAAYRLLKQKQGGKVAMDQAAEVARKAIFDGHFNYTSNNRARYMKGDVAKVLTMFKQYSQHMTYLLARNAYLSLRGQGMEKAEARKTLAGVLGMHFAFAGALGLPGMSVLFWTLDKVLGDDDEPFDSETAFRNFLADSFGADLGHAIAKGGVNAATGIDLHSRVSLNDLWFRDAGRPLEGREQALYALEQVAGPMAGIGLNFWQGLDMALDGDLERGTEKMAPKFARDWLRTVRYTADGAQTYQGDPIIEDFGPLELFAQSQGFAPARLGEAYDARSAIKNKESAISDRRRELLNDLYESVKEKDLKQRAKALKAIREYNKKNPRARIDPKDIQRSLKARQRGDRQTEKGVFLPKSKEWLREEGRFAG